MIASRTSLRRIGWAALLAVCCALLFALSLRVNALKSEVRRAENRIVALRTETMYLETEYETRSNQQQLSAWNAVDFGYVAPNAGQYMENVRQLAALGKAAAPDAPAPIRVASAPTEAPGVMPAMVSPLTGKPLGAEDEAEDAAPVDHDTAAAALDDRLGKVEHDRPATPGRSTKAEKKPSSEGVRP
ncbi:hypothetical protein [Novosphingobium sp. Gsoil 351]|uniref:hypothetical protein n=1 Tax=Novosphingobium sp. Gsoil 351 TaxID=2675225 RepID=UPI0012B4A6C6|nr:hypothetical protein [Novosphingobium sp. Gsoil 351]QGN55567.1 hypothetical protein GKE62_14430 [Novosphingobium sp. Gsoil 351]